jgi:hypothetical protein
MLRKSVLTRGDAPRVAAAVKEVLSNPSYARAAAVASERLRAARVPYRAQAADWVEYAAALKDHGSFLHTQGQRMLWWQVCCLDVALIALAVVAAPCWWMYRLWAAGKRAGGAALGDADEDNAVQVQLAFPPGTQLEAAKQLRMAKQGIRLAQPAAAVAADPSVRTLTASTLANGARAATAAAQTPAPRRMSPPWLFRRRPLTGEAWAWSGARVAERQQEQPAGRRRLHEQRSGQVLDEGPGEQTLASQLGQQLLFEDRTVHDKFA